MIDYVVHQCSRLLACHAGPAKKAWRNAVVIYSPTCKDSQVGTSSRTSQPLWREWLSMVSIE